MCRLKTLVWAGLLICWLASGIALAQDAPPGGIRLLSGYEHKRGQGIDSWVGTIWKPGGLAISYDIGPMAGNYANNYEIKDRKWIKRQVINGQVVLALLTNDDTLFVIFVITENGAPANFYAKIKSQEEIAEILLMVLAYRDTRAGAATLPTAAASTQPAFDIECIQGTFYRAPNERWHIYIKPTGDAQVTLSDSKGEGKQYKSHLSSDEMAALARVFKDWHELDRRYLGTKSGNIYPILDYGLLEVSPEQGSNPPRQFLDAAQLLTNIGTRVSGQALNK